MSGHSKWHKIQHKKAITDSKKSKLFGSLSREIKIAARQGTDPATNSNLREAIDRAKKANLPQENIDRLLSRDTANQTEAWYEGYGSGGAAVLVSAATDNTNRTVTELRTLFKQHEGSLGSAGSVKWKFSFSPTGSAVPLYQHTPPSAEDASRVKALIEELEAHPDVTAVYTDQA